MNRVVEHLVCPKKGSHANAKFNRIVAQRPQQHSKTKLIDWTREHVLASAAAKLAAIILTVAFVLKFTS